MASNLVSITRRPFGQTMRKDTWWIAPLLTFIGLGSSLFIRRGPRFRAIITASAIIFRHFILPSFSEIRRTRGSAQNPRGYRRGCRSHPHFLILWAPGGFRFTCYYYRGAYYKAMWADPPACAVGEPRNGYRGERKFPLILQNVHRYFLYLALLFLIFLAYDARKAMWFAGA